MSAEERLDAVKKNVEGKAQETIGEVTGDPEDKAAGKSKQIQAEAKHAKEDVKDSIKEQVDKS